jgi:3-methyladenine DNA glycosylase/8-oxoguanine DNA glycosylase
MIERLTTRLGRPFPGQEAWQAFPTPAAIAAAGPEFLKQETGLGYRSLYVWELATAVAEGRLDLERFEAPGYPVEELYRALRRIKGVGDYAAATILMLLGRYEQLAIDSEMRAFVARKYTAGQPATDAQIRAIYAPWGRWQYLAYWFDLIE